MAGEHCTTQSQADDRKDNKKDSNELNHRRYYPIEERVREVPLFIWSYLSHKIYFLTDKYPQSLPRLFLLS
jgi:hypothetical protein